MTSKFVYVYDMQTGNAYPVAPLEATWQTAPSVSGNTVVWLDDDGTAFKIAAWDYNTRTLADSVTAAPGDYYTDPLLNAFPKVSGNEIVWQDYSGTDWNVYNYTIGAGTGIPNPLIANSAYDEKNPVISGNFIAYENWSSGNSDIYLFLRSNGTTIRVSDSAENDLCPAIDGNTIVWESTSPLTGHQIIDAYDIRTGIITQITPLNAGFDQKNPEISGNTIVMEDYRESAAYPDVYSYDLSGGSEAWLTPGSAGSKKNPAVAGDRVVWKDYRADYACGGTCQGYDIYLLTLGAAEICPTGDFTITNPAGPPPLNAIFSDVSSSGTSGAVFHIWNFSDGSSWSFDPGLSVSHTFAADGTYPVRLYLGNARCRNLTDDRCTRRVFVNQAPVADFTATPDNGFAPLAVSFTDTSCGGPSSWSWDFGDGSVADPGQNPAHSFGNAATTYMVKLTATNLHGSNNTQKSVRTFMGGQSAATIPVSGIRVETRFGGPFLIFNATELSSFAPAVPDTLISIRTPSGNFWENITFISQDGVGLKKSATNSTYFGNISRVYLKTNDTVINAAGTPPPVGTGWGVNYQLNTTTYPDPGAISTELREGSLGTEWDTFDSLCAKCPAIRYNPPGYRVHRKIQQEWYN